MVVWRLVGARGSESDKNATEHVSECNVASDLEENNCRSRMTRRNSSPDRSEPEMTNSSKLPIVSTPTGV